MTFLLFDAYGTLVALDDFYTRLREGFAQNDFEYSMQSIQNAAHREMRHYICHAKNARDSNSHEALRRECAQILADSLNADSPRELPFEFAYRVLDASIIFAPFEETRAVLSQLRARGIGMAVASNWDYALPQVLRDMDLAHYFEFIQTSAQVGCEKPDAQFFEFALREVRRRHPQIAPRDVIYIGDHYEKDVLAPQNLGMNAQWIVRDARDIASGETHSSQSVKPLHSLRDLLPLLDIEPEYRVLDRVFDVAERQF